MVIYQESPYHVPTTLQQQHQAGQPMPPSLSQIPNLPTQHLIYSSESFPSQQQQQQQSVENQRSTQQQPQLKQVSHHNQQQQQYHHVHQLSPTPPPQSPQQQQQPMPQTTMHSPILQQHQKIHANVPHVKYVVLI